jgi:hypothetical protein
MRSGITDYFVHKTLFSLVLIPSFVVSCGKNKDLNPDSDQAVIAVIQGVSEILGRPENNSVNLSIMFDRLAEVYCEYGTSQGLYNMKTAVYSAVKDTPVEIDFLNLNADTKYFYRTRYRFDSANESFLASTEHTFHTQRLPGSTFSFMVEADEHLYDKKGVKSIYQVCLNNQAIDRPDFMISLGDIFGDDHKPVAITSAELNLLHKQYRPFLGSICHSIPLFICLGNHEGENDYYMAQNPPDNLAINGTLWRKFYYPNPYPDSFYTGNQEIEPYGIGNPENYYSWTWGDALFVILDVYRYECKTSDKPQGWDWSLGLSQYTWLKNTLEKSTARYKFVFAHHIRGQGRGGITNARLYEWGGYEADGISYAFNSKRPGWGKPIHTLFVDNKVNIFFQGHDHVFAHEVMDGVTYQALPMPSDSTYQIGILANGDSYTSDVVGGTGHLRVNVAPAGITVDFIQAYLPADENGTRKNGNVAFSYFVH